MTKTQQVTDKLGTQPYASFTTRRGELKSSYRGIRPSLVAEVSESDDGLIEVTTWVDYGNDGRSFCECKRYKSTAGALRMIRAHLHFSA